MTLRTLILLLCLTAPAVARDAAPEDDLAGNPFAAASYPDAARYRACLAQVRDRPEVALEAAALWRAHEGGVPAKHCTAIALLMMERYEEAAAWFDEAAQDVFNGKGLHALGASKDLRLAIELKGQAGNAWMLVGNYERAFATLSDGIARLPDAAPFSAELLIDRARAAAGLGDYDRAVSDLTRVIERQPQRVEAFVLRATAHRYRGAIDEAEYDILRALALDADDGEALFERGALRRLSGDDRRARQDWERVAALYPGSAIAELALDNLELLNSE